MYEFIPIVLGGLVGLACAGPQLRSVRAVTIGALGATIGVLVAIISGEVAHSPLFAVLDAAQGAVAAIACAALARTYTAHRRADATPADGSRRRR